MSRFLEHLGFIHFSEACKEPRGSVGMDTINPLSPQEKGQPLFFCVSEEHLLPLQQITPEW